MATIKLDDMTVTYKDNQEVRNAVFEAVIAYYIKHECFNGESICQSDGPVIDGHACLADIADDIMKFDVEYS